MSEKKEEEILERCTARVDAEGNLHMTYRWSGCDVDGSDYYDGDDLHVWKDHEVQALAAEIIGAEGDCIKTIQVVRE